MRFGYTRIRIIYINFYSDLYLNHLSPILICRCALGIEAAEYYLLIGSTKLFANECIVIL